MIAAAFVSFISFALLLSHLSPKLMRLLVGYKVVPDVLLHTTILILFLGTMSGLLQAEAAGICFSLYLRLYAKLFGYTRFNWSTRKFDRYDGFAVRLAR